MSDPRDQSVRDQAIREPDRSMFLEAGAGTGKTRTMIERLVAAIGKGQTIESQVAITFTVKAAWEIADRLRKELGKGDSDAARQAVRELSEMRAGTIDSLVQRLLEAYPLEAGVAAGFRIFSEAEFQDRFETWFHVAYGEWTQEASLVLAWDKLDLLDIKLRDSQRLLHCLANPVARSGVAPAILGVDFDPLAALTRWEDAHLRPLEGGLIGTPAFVAGAATFLGRLRANAASLRDDPTSAISDPDSLGTTGGAAAKPVRDLLKEASRELKSVAEQARFRELAPLFQRVVSDAAVHAQFLRREGLLSFEQAHRAAVELLENHPSVLAQIQGEISGVMVGEFQDTSPEQLKLVRLLSDHGRIPLFTVGDPKQSIYRFRGADLDGYLAFRAEAPGLPMAIGNLTTNFRSRPEFLLSSTSCSSRGLA